MAAAAAADNAVAAAATTTTTTTTKTAAAFAAAADTTIENKCFITAPSCIKIIPTLYATMAILGSYSQHFISFVTYE